jgi:hypothetical protein
MSSFSRSAICLAVILSSLWLPLTATAVELYPFATRNLNPLIQIYGLPAAEPARQLDSGHSALRLSFEIANSYSGHGAADEKVSLDGESYYSTLSWRYGYSDRLELGLDLPYISHNGGFLDGFIEGWHDVFHLPGANRDKAPRDQLNYRYQRDGRTLTEVNDSTNGFGDLRLNAAWQLSRVEGERSRATSLRISLKLPTGDDEDLLGSGGTDLALSLAGHWEVPSSVGRLALFGSIGALLMEKGDVLEDQRRQLAGFGSLGCGWAPKDWLALKLQIDGHTAIYDDSSLDEINSASLQLTLGGTLGLTETTSLDLGVGEDIVVDTSPDVSFHLALRTLF